MSRFTNIAVILATSCLTLATPGTAQTAQDDTRFRLAQTRLQNELRAFQQEFDRYQQASSRRGGGYGGPGGGYNDGPGGPGGYYNDDRVESGYEPSRYYRDGPNYQERVLGPDDRVYRGNDGRYYCKRNDGTTGLIVGAIGGGILGNIIDGGHSRGVGTILGAIVGGAAGSSIDRNNQQVRCR
ncbi:MAG: glycine zipper protein [Sphingomonas bacterium]|uniref:glycine zipper 2TM domain-containing protein n=1 Tax=Sphingomonas bacterium TaxID=1895847 RepID=UPI00261616C4|nr:glycine zipper 2TM domain-containing protein [Sphingomonas bacterium]MDB5705751.1 glycine zipper protein [Sphingomonas bacterium]